MFLSKTAIIKATENHLPCTKQQKKFVGDHTDMLQKQNHSFLMVRRAWHAVLSFCLVSCSSRHVEKLKYSQLFGTRHGVALVVNSQSNQAKGGLYYYSCYKGKKEEDGIGSTKRTTASHPEITDESNSLYTILAFLS